MTRLATTAPVANAEARPGVEGHEAPSRRQFLSVALQAAGLLVALPLIARQAHAQPRPSSQPAGSHTALPAMTVYKDAECGCCKEWVKHVQKAGFVVTAYDMPDMNAVKTRFGVPGALQSCHTAVVGAYVLEGHVPADLVARLVREKPAALGLAVPGMPQGSPGMEGPDKDKYDVVLFERSGKTRVYASR